jgi:hypothetical protein
VPAPSLCSCGWHIPAIDVQTADGSALPSLYIEMHCPICRKLYTRGEAVSVPPEPTERELAEDRTATLAEERD